MAATFTVFFAFRADGFLSVAFVSSAAANEFAVAVENAPATAPAKKVRLSNMLPLLDAPTQA
jgi:hypothetical protein